MNFREKSTKIAGREPAYQVCDKQAAWKTTLACRDGTGAGPNHASLISCHSYNI